MFNWKWEGLEQVMDWITVAGIVSATILLIIALIQAAKEKAALSKEHEGLSKEHGGLSKEHEGLSKEHRSIQETLLRENAHLLETSKETHNAIVVLDKFIAQEAIKQKKITKNLTSKQKDIRKQIAAISDMLSEMEELQSRVVTLEEENALLRMEVHSYEQTRQQSQGFEQTLFFDPDR